MKKFTFGTPEKFVPTRFCKGLNYVETDIKYDVSRIQAKENSKGYAMLLPKGKDEEIFGFGLQHTQVNFSKAKLTLRCNADAVKIPGDSHAPVPFFVSTAGYGIFFDTARAAEFDVGAVMQGMTVADRTEVSLSEEELYEARKAEGDSVIAVQIPVAKGVDIYIFEGETITDIVAQYNMFSGGGCEVPEWSLGVFYRCCGEWVQDQVIEMADYFRDNDFPVTILGLEPGWHKYAYPCSFTWRDSKFPDPDSMLKYLQEKGYHISLWEHCYTHPSAPFYEELKPYSCNFKVFGGLVPDFTLPEARQLFIDHHKNYVMKYSIDGFKLDECDGSDFSGGWSFPNMAEFPSGIDGDQYKSLLGVLYVQTLMEAMDGTPTLSEARSMGSLSAPYPFVLYSDLYDHKEFIRACITSGFSGLLWTPEVRKGYGASRKAWLRRLQHVVFSPQCLINAWNTPVAPWVEYDCVDEVREILNTRTTLIPYLMDAFKIYKEKGIAPVRALVSDYTDDPETYHIDDEYLFCENLLVAPIIGENDGRKVYLPAGEWVDFFTGEKQESGWFEVETTNIPVYKRIK